MNKNKSGFAQIVFLGIGLLVLVGAIGTSVAVVNKKYGPKEGTPAVSNSAASEKEKQGNANGEMNGWKTYKNEKYGLEFKYPKYLSIDTKNTPSTGDSVIFTPKDQLDMMFYGMDSFGGLGNRKFSSLEEYFSAYAYDLNYDRTQITFGNLNWLKFVSKQRILSQNKNNGSVRYTLQKDGGIYEFVFHGQINASNIELFEKVVRTFKFTDKSETANWKTYKNEKYSYEFKYPANWTLKETDAVMQSYPYTLVSTHVFKGGFENPEAMISIYPQGFPAEGILGEKRTSTIKISNIKEASDIILADGRIRETFITFKNTPPLWNQYNYIRAWLRVEDEVCLKGGEVFKADDGISGCYGNGLKIQGKINDEDRKILENILSTFKFTNKSETAVSKTYTSEDAKKIANYLVSFLNSHYYYTTMTVNGASWLASGPNTGGSSPAMLPLNVAEAIKFSLNSPSCPSGYVYNYLSKLTPGTNKQAFLDKMKSDLSCLGTIEFKNTTWGQE